MKRDKGIKDTLLDMPHLRAKMDKIDRQRLSRIREARDTKTFRHVIEDWAEEKLRPKILSERQRMAIYLMSDFVHNFSYKYICTRLQIPESDLSKWRNDPLFIRELDKEINKRMTFLRVHAWRNVHRAVMRGSMKDTWKYLQMIGDLKERHEIVDRTGERELDDDELKNEISRLTTQLSTANTPSGN